ncbi:hypothetical protein, partial [Enterococcus sp. CWB-B31]|uniref:hypothetical protein n=1 Tax=Enterococcus sp. CWB-B31 TaxID=2885159 RepID=UPI001E5E0D6C
VVSNCGASGRPFFSGPFRLWPVIEAFSRRANLQFTLEVLIGLPSMASFNGGKSTACPSIGKSLAEDKGVYGDTGSEGSLKQISGLTNRNYIKDDLG